MWSSSRPMGRIRSQVFLQNAENRGDKKSLPGIAWKAEHFLTDG